MKRWGLLLVVVLVFPASARAVTLLRPDGVVAEPYQRWMAGLNEPTVAGIVVLHTYSRCPASGPTVMACASPGPQPAIWMRFRDRGTLLHELGHLFAFSVGEPSTERFADSYAFCARPLRSELQPVATEWWYPTAGALLHECDRMRALGGWVMTPYEVSMPG